MSGEERRAELSLEQRARIAARLALHRDRPRSEVLAPFEVSEQVWDDDAAQWARRLTEEIRGRSGSTVPIEERYPLSSAYAKAYAEAMREARAELERDQGEPRDEREEDATIRIAPGASRDEPFGLLGASNRAAAQVRAGAPAGAEGTRPRPPR